MLRRDSPCTVGASDSEGQGDDRLYGIASVKLCASGLLEVSPGDVDAILNRQTFSVD